MNTRPPDEADDGRLAQKLRQDEEKVRGSEPAEEAGIDLEPVTDEKGDPEP